MPMFDFICQKCGFKFEEIVRRPSDTPDRCPMRCENATFKKHHNVVISNVGFRDSQDFPRKSGINETKPVMTKNGPVLASVPVIFNSRTDMDRKLKKHGYVRYDKSSKSNPMNGTPPTPDAETKERLDAIEHHPLVREYRDQQRKGEIPQAMNLSSEELAERFTDPEERQGAAK